MITLILDQMKEIVTKILDVIMFLVPFFGKRKRTSLTILFRFLFLKKGTRNMITSKILVTISFI